MANTAGARTSTNAYLPLDGSHALLGVHGLFQGSITLDGAMTLTTAYPTITKIDPGGAHRDVTLEAEADSFGKLRFIVNSADGAENLVVKDDGGNTISTLNQNECALFACNGTAWEQVVLFTHALS